MPDPHSEATREVAHELPYRDELKRKALHLLALVVPLGMYVLGRPVALLILAPAALLALTADTLRAYSVRFARVIARVFGPLMRAEEWGAKGQPAADGDVTFNGATLVLVSAALLTLIFPLRLAVPVFAMFMIGDAAAALVGRRFGRVHWGRNPRTLEGSAAFLAAGLAVMACFPAVGFWIGAAGTVAGCLAEALPRPFNDNLRVPLVAASVMAFLEWLVQGRAVALFSPFA